MVEIRQQCEAMLAWIPGARVKAPLQERRSARLAGRILRRLGKATGDGSEGSAINRLAIALYKGAYEAPPDSMVRACRYALDSKRRLDDDEIFLEVPTIFVQSER